MNQLDCSGWTFSSTGTASLTLRRIDERCASQTTNAISALKLDYLGDTEWADTCASQAPYTFIWIHLGNDTTQLEVSLREKR